MWNNLSMSERSELMKLYLENGVTSLSAMKEHYNSFADGGELTFQQWKDYMQKKYPDLEMDSAKAGYDYETYFKDNYGEAIKQLMGLQHFPDTYKLPNHTTFSDESIYSRGPMIGGSWSYNKPWDNQWSNTEGFTPSIVNRQQHPEIYREDRTYSEREIYRNSFATGGQMNTDGPDKPSQGKTITVTNPLFTTTGTISKEDIDWDLGNLSAFEETMKGIELAGNYFSSEGFKNRAKTANEKYGQLYNTDRPLRKIVPQQAAFIRNNNDASAAFKFGLNNSLNPVFVGAHETGHHNPVFSNHTFGMTPEEKAEMSNPKSTLYSPLYRNDYRNVPEEWRDILRNENPANAHDAELSEAYSDLIGLRALLKTYNIFDSTDPKAKFTQEMLDAFRKKLGNTGNRFLDYHSDENIIRAVNEIAQNTSPSQDTPHYAALGGHLFKDGGPDGSKEDRPYTEEEIYSHRFQEGGGIIDFWKNMRERVEKAKEKAKIINHKRVRRNDTPTATASEKFEDEMNNDIWGDSLISKIKSKYTIPYIPEKEIRIDGNRTSENVLDTLYKYAKITNLPFVDALGLANQETSFGSLPTFNFLDLDNPPEYEDGTMMSKKDIIQYNNELANSNYFRNYGIIPANNLVRNFHWEEDTDMSEHPLINAFNYFKAGKYNTGDANHNADVRRKGLSAINSPAVKAWMKKKGINNGR